MKKPYKVKNQRIVRLQGAMEVSAPVSSFSYTLFFSHVLFFVASRVPLSLVLNLRKTLLAL